MKKFIIITGCMALVSILLTSEPSEKNKADAAAPDADNSISQKSEVIEDMYTLKEYNKRLAVFQDGNGEPIFITNVFVSELPKADRELMKKGIPAHDDKALKRLLEDYCS